MAGTEQAPLIQLDTHAVIWLFEGAVERLSTAARQAIEAGRCAISPMVRMELQYMFEIGRNETDARTVLDIMRAQFDLDESRTDFSLVVMAALPLTWTRDPFDRLIAAQAICDQAILITKDRSIRKHCPNARW
jgi:PIN domain nuclease of toxin-antitoxin system